MARKQRFRTTYAWIYRMRCAAYVDCCPTTFNIFSYDWESSQVYLEFQCDLGCVHPAGKTYGQVRGAARAALLASGLRPHAMVADAMSKALPEAKATGNFTGIPSRHAAKKISSEYLNIGRMDADVEESLNKIRLQFQSHDETSKIFKGLVHDIVCDDDSVSFSLYSEGAHSCSLVAFLTRVCDCLQLPFVFWVSLLPTLGSCFVITQAVWFGTLQHGMAALLLFLILFWQRIRSLMALLCLYSSTYPI